jgi:hypothetical protein
MPASPLHGETVGQVTEVSMESEICHFRNALAATPLVQDHIVQGGTRDGIFHAAKTCLGCGHVFFDPPNEKALTDYYNTEYNAIASASWYNVSADYAVEKVTYRSGRIIDIAERFGFSTAHVYHEIGCAFGGTVHEMNRLNFPTTGTDLNRVAIESGQAYGNTRIAAEPDTTFLACQSIMPNVVYGYHVLEHMPDPAEYLKSLAPCLAKESVVVLFVPNSMTLLPLSYGYRNYVWFHYPAHLNMFSPASVRCLADTAGYELLDISTTACGIDPAASARIAELTIDTPVTRALRDRMLAEALLHEELAFVLTPANSPVAARYREQVLIANHRSASSQSFEGKLVATARSSPLATQAQPETARDSPVPCDVSAALCEAREAARERVQLLQRCHRAETALDRIEKSFFWGATAVPRRLVDAARRLQAKLS